MIKLPKGYFIEASKTCFVLKKLYIGIDKKNKEEKELSKFIGYYGSFVGVLEGILRDYQKELTRKEILTLQDFVSQMKVLKEELIDCYKGIGNIDYSELQTIDLDDDLDDCLDD